MPEKSFTARGIAVPSGRFGRVARFGGMAGGVAGNIAYHGAREALQGRRPDFRRLLLTPANVTRFTAELARMRGAAMKVGQLLSMETGDFLAPELSDILARLRAEADFMPPAQLRGVLEAAWGRGFQSRLSRFDVRPVAAASIGQVHRARTRDGADLAIKVQYPGVRRSIDSDVDNVAALIRLTGLLPGGIDIAPLLAEAKTQLHDEADYTREGVYLQRFGALLETAPEFAVPSFHADLSGRDILAMGFMPGRPVEDLQSAPQEVRDTVVTRLVALTLRELFEFGVMQTDPNFANYRWCDETGRVELLDFGAARAFPGEVAAAFRRLLRAGMDGGAAGMADGLREIGIVDADTAPHHADTIVAMAGMAMDALRGPDPFDFAATDLVERLRARGMILAEGRDFATVPPVDTLFVQRKVAGMFLLGARLRARVPLAELVRAYL